MYNATTSGSITKGIFGEKTPVIVGSERREHEAVGERTQLYQAKYSPLNSVSVILGENVMCVMV